MSNLNVSDTAILFGDYNQPALVWSTSRNGLPVIDVQQSSLSIPSSILLDGFSLNSLTQINAVANRSNRILDFVLVSDKIACESTVSNALEPLSVLDPYHPALEVTVELLLPTAFEDVVDLQSLNFHRADFATLSERILEIDWRFLEMAECVDDAVNYFNEKVNEAIRACVPLRRPVPKPPWSNRRLRQMKRLRSRALRNYTRSRCLILKRVFNQASNRYRITYRL